MDNIKQINFILYSILSMSTFIPSTIYKQFYNYIPLDEMKGLQWFALEPNYGSSYGPIHKSYRFKRNPKLLDIGDANIRTMIRETIEPYNSSIVNLSDPDEQYSGGQSNKKYHELVKQFFGNLYDGTIINEHSLKGNKDYSVEDLEGPSEIVLWSNSCHDLLEEIPKTSGKSKTKGKKIRKTKKTKKKRSKRRKGLSL